MSKEQELARRILNVLPGTDCGGFGGCGLSTCQDCAAAIAEDKDVARCPACEQEQVNAIAGILGVETVTVLPKVAFIRCSGDAAKKEKLPGVETCEAAGKAGFFPEECQYGCIGIGSCVERCTFNAMQLEDGHVIIDKTKCNGCLACVSACPQELIQVVPKDASNFIPCSSKADEETTLETCGHGCIGCGECENACPEGAVTIIDNCAVIDYDKCAGCVACTVKCKKKIIVDELHDLTAFKEEVALVRCVGGARASKKLKALGLEDCADAANLNLAAMDACPSSCVGLGNCTKVCRFDAISVESGVAYVDYDKCVGCGDCQRACPRNMIDMVPYKGVKQVPCSAKAIWEERLNQCDIGCIACGDCADNCPNGAISMKSGNPVIDSDLCENCGVCTYVCSRGLIAERKVPEYKYLQAEAMRIDRPEITEERKW